MLSVVILSLLLSTIVSGDRPNIRDVKCSLMPIVVNHFRHNWRRMKASNYTFPGGSRVFFADVAQLTFADFNVVFTDSLTARPR